MNSPSKIIINYLEELFDNRLIINYIYFNHSHKQRKHFTTTAVGKSQGATVVLVQNFMAFFGLPPWPGPHACVCVGE